MLKIKQNLLASSMLISALLFAAQANALTCSTSADSWNNGYVVNVPSYQLKPGDIVSLKDKSKDNASVTGKLAGKNPKFSWLDWNEAEMKGTFIAYPERENVPENIKEQLIVELYSK